MYVLIKELDFWKSSLKTLERHFLALVRLVREEEMNGFIALVGNQLGPWCQYMRRIFDSFCQKIDEIYVPIRHVEDVKQFAKQVPNTEIGKYCFQLKKLKMNNAQEYFRHPKVLADTRTTRLLEKHLFL